jgi:hypothetical protein
LDNDPRAVLKQPQKLPWWLIFLQLSPLILQLVGEFMARSSASPIEEVPSIVRVTPVADIPLTRDIGSEVGHD